MIMATPQNGESRMIPLRIGGMMIKGGGVHERLRPCMVNSLGFFFLWTAFSWVVLEPFVVDALLTAGASC